MKEKKIERNPRYFYEVLQNSFSMKLEITRMWEN